MKILGYRCSQLAYVMDDGLLGSNHVILAGHEFRRFYEMKLLKFIPIFLIFFYNVFFSQEVFYWRIKTNEKVLFLTFDDGPGNYTEKILDVLKEKNIKSTFFVISDYVKRRKNTLKRIFNEGHSVGNHTTSRHYNFYRIMKNKDLRFCKELLIKEVRETEKVIMDTIGIKPIYLRMPYGFYHKWMDDILKELNYKVVNWTFGYDWYDVSEEEMFKKYCQAVKPGSIFLFHDGGKNGEKTLSVLKKIIRYSVSKGYRFDDLRKWINHK